MTTDKRAARQILAAYYAGYPQVPGILAWAARYTKFKEGFRILQDILRDCQDEDVLTVVADSAAAIGKYGLPILEQLSSNESMQVRMHVIDACRQSVEYIRPLLQRFVESGDEAVRAYAAFACGTHGVAALPWLERLAHDDSCKVRVAVAKSVWRLGEAAIPILEKLQHDEDIHVRHEALVSFRIVGQDIEFASDRREKR
jgi:HEAT repeat protein